MNQKKPDDRAQKYEVAKKAYLKKNYDVAAGILDRLVKDPSCTDKVHLLRGHTYAYGLHSYKIAKLEYEWVLYNSVNPVYIEPAVNGLQMISEHYSISSNVTDEIHNWIKPNSSDLGKISGLFVSQTNSVDNGNTLVSTKFEPPDLDEILDDEETYNISNNFSIADDLTIDRSDVFDFNEPIKDPRSKHDESIRESVLKKRSFIKVTPTAQEPLPTKIISFFKKNLEKIDTATVTEKSLLVSKFAGIGTASILTLALVTGLLFAKPDRLRPYYISSGILSIILSSAATFSVANFLIKKDCDRAKLFVDESLDRINRIDQGDHTRKKYRSQGEYGLALAHVEKMISSLMEQRNIDEDKNQALQINQESLKTQVIVLLEKIEEIRAGDLTVTNIVTADVLGAVADSFNLTFGALKTLMRDVKKSVAEFGSIAGNNQVFARQLSIDAAQSSDVLATTVNSVQMMSGSIRRVSANAVQAREVATIATDTANLGYNAVYLVDRSINEILDTVARSTRRMKILAESSQQIAEIIGVVSQISDRTNLLALNASIEAARAGESGKGFSTVADEIRQLADRSVKAVNSIRSIVTDIQSETRSVMAVMEAGTLQVSKGTKLAEEAKESLQNILSVSTVIDRLVNSITIDTLEQTRIAGEITGVITSAELLSRSTATESKQVSQSLENIGFTADMLLECMEKFITN